MSLENPADIQQAAIGLGMGLFTRYRGVINSDGSEMTVREALGEISRIADSVLDSEVADMDPVTRWVVQWLEMHGTNSGPFGEADLLAQSKGLSMESPAMQAVAIVKGGKVRLRTVPEFRSHKPPAELPMSRYAMGRFLAVLLVEGGMDAAAAALSQCDERDWGPIPTLAARIVRISEPPKKSITAEEAHPWHALASEWDILTARAREQA